MQSVLNRISGAGSPGIAADDEDDDDCSDDLPLDNEGWHDGSPGGLYILRSLRRHHHPGPYHPRAIKQPCHQLLILHKSFPSQEQFQLMLHYKRRCPLGNPVLIRTAKGEILVSETRLKMGSHLIFPRVLPIASPPPPFATSTYNISIPK